MANTPPRPCAQAAADPWALLLWVGINSSSLFLSAARWNLWPGAPRPVESTAAYQLLVIDAIAAALMCPLFLTGGRRAALIALASAPFVEIAGFFGGASTPHLAAAYLMLTVWLATLLVWQMAFPSRRGRMIVVAAASGWTIGLATIAYLNYEFVQSGIAEPGGRSIVQWTPLSMITLPLDGQYPNVIAVTILGCFLAAGAAVARVRCRRRAYREQGRQNRV